MLTLFRVGSIRLMPLSKVLTCLSLLSILTSIRVVYGQPPSKTVRLFSSAEAGFVTISSPTVSEIDNQSVIFFAGAQKRLQGHTYKHFSSVPFIVIFVRGAGSGVNGEGQVGIFQRAAFLFRGTLSMASDSIVFEYNLAQIESEMEVIVQDAFSISLTRDTKTLLDESLDLEDGRVLVVDVREGENMRVYQRNIALPDPQLLDGVWNPEKEQPLREWTHAVIKAAVQEEKLKTFDK